VAKGLLLLVTIVVLAHFAPTWADTAWCARDNSFWSHYVILENSDQKGRTACGSLHRQHKFAEREGVNNRRSSRLEGTDIDSNIGSGDMADNLASLDVANRVVLRKTKSSSGVVRFTDIRSILIERAYVLDPGEESPTEGQATVIESDHSNDDAPARCQRHTGAGAATGALMGIAVGKAIMSNQESSSTFGGWSSDWVAFDDFTPLILSIFGGIFVGAAEGSLIKTPIEETALTPPGPDAFAYPPQGPLVDVTDMTAVVAGFTNENWTSKLYCDLIGLADNPSNNNVVIDVSDMTAVVDAFGGAPYPGMAPQDCP